MAIGRRPGNSRKQQNKNVLKTRTPNNSRNSRGSRGSRYSGNARNQVPDTQATLENQAIH